MDYFRKIAFALLILAFLDLVVMLFVGLKLHNGEGIEPIYQFVPPVLLMLSMGQIFFGMLNALQYKWFMFLPFFTCMLCWVSVYIELVQGWF
jgi:hypothetical protein